MMGRCIFRINDLYFEWSSIVDAPITFGLTLDELTAHIKDEYGSEGLRELPERLARVEKFGTSVFASETVDDLLSGNRAGPNERRLSKNQIYLAYGKRESILGGWVNDPEKGWIKQQPAESGKEGEHE